MLTFKKYYRLFFTIIIWTGLILRLIDIIIIGLKKGQLARYINIYFSYFTIEANLMLAILLTILTFKKQTFTYPILRGAIVLYIIATGLIYYLLLADIHIVDGISLIAANILHYVTPPLALIDWIIFKEKADYKFHYSFTWLIFPLIYFLYSLIRGLIIDIYPYPFINVNTHGYLTVIKNAFVLSFAFLVLGFIIIAFKKLQNR